MKVLLKVRWFAVFLALAAVLGWTVRVLPAAAAKAGAVCLAEGGGSGEDGESGEGIDFA